MLVCGIINELEEQSKDLLSYFFCQGTDSRSNTATSVLRGLIYRLVSQQRSLIQYVRNKTHGDQSIFDNTNGWYAASDIFRNILQDKSLEPAVLIIDALDECQVQVEQLLRLIIDTPTSNPRIKWIVSSRNLQHIGRVLNAANIEGRVMLSLEMKSASVSDAVGIYIRNQVSKLQTLRDDPNLRRKFEETILQKANGTFLWVALIFKKLRVLDDEEFEDSSGILTALEEVPTELTDLYSRMFQQIERPGSNNSRLCKTILATMFIACRPLHVLELPILSGFEGNLAKTDTLERLIKLCGSFLTLQKDTNMVYFVHQSAKDFLATDSTAFSAIFQFGKGTVHRDLFIRSIQALKKTLRRNMYGLLYPGVLIDEITKPDPDPLAKVHYSCFHWINHFCDCDQNRDMTPWLEGDEVVQMAHDFIENCYLYWLEAASLYGGVSIVVSEIRRLKDLAKAHKWEGLANLVHDAHRFILSYRQVIETAPLQVYVSALIFSLIFSLVRRKFEPLEGPKWITKKPTMQPEWDACLLTLEGHKDRVASISFTRDGKIQASGSNDGTIRVWDSSTGACLKSWKAHDGECVTTVAFAPGWSSAVLASGGHDKLVKIWDIATDYALLYTLEGHEGSVTNVAFIDGKTLLSLSDDKTVRRWDLMTGTLLSTTSLPQRPLVVSPNGRYVTTGIGRTLFVLELDYSRACQTVACHVKYDCDVVFLPDNTRLVSSAFDRDIAEIWDLVTGSCLNSFAGCGPVAISADGTRMASGSQNLAVKIWDLVEGSLLQNIQHPTGWIEALSFSPDGKQLASGSTDEIVRIWDPALEPSLQPLNNAERPMDLHMSPDGMWIVSEGRFGPIRILDTATGELHHMIEKTNGADLIAFSPDGLWIATASKLGNTINICEIGTWKVENYCSDNLDGIRSLAFSPDGLWLASGLEEGSINVWDAKAWKLQYRRRHHMMEVTSVILSPQTENGLLASGSHLGVINIWVVSTGIVLKTLPSSGPPTQMEFSPNGLWLASGCQKTVEVWDVNQGSLLMRVADYFHEISWRSSGNILLLSNIDILSTQWRISHALDGKGLVYYRTEVTPEVHLSSDWAWILVRGKRAVWLPTQYRPETDLNLDKPKVIIRRSGIGILSVSREVLFFQFEMSETDILWS
ncbi:hypothetical protein NM208_g5181 [Fusarium decemcellulare]|uniref:Uncharacterized protein n=1 Tax=Fusarium decemcellulare TaxID=57161 RepID=A0ACC1SHZ4_9HYPO|nr:hypothetical protein NM208_g5181 [Fusarium decemcellulare]